MSLVELQPGLYPGVPNDQYHLRVPGLVSKSVLDLLDRSPKHYETWLSGFDPRPTPALLFGSALHCALLEPEVFMATYAELPDHGDMRTNAAKAKRADWLACNAGKKALDSDDFKAIVGMFKSVHAHPLAGKMIADGRPELTVRWRDEETGLECKARADYYVEHLDACFDVKTTVDARSRAFARSVAEYGYHRQHAFYADGFRHVGATLKHFVFIAIEKTEPYAVALYNLDAYALAKGHASIRRNMATMAECIERGTYPGYETTIQTLELPPWA